MKSRKKIVPRGRRFLALACGLTATKLVLWIEKLLTDPLFPAKLYCTQIGNKTSAAIKIKAETDGSYLLKLMIRILPLCLIVAFTNTMADDNVPHQHKPMVVRSRPVIERLALKVISPVDVVSTDVATFVADSAGKVIFRIDSEDQTSIVGQDLDGLSRLAAHRLGNFALLAKKTSGQIVQFTESGFLGEEPISLNFAPAGLAFDDRGNLWTGNAQQGEVLRFTKEDNGWARKSITVSEPVVDLVIDQQGNVIILLRSGKLLSIRPSEEIQVAMAGYAPESASRLSLHPEEGVVALAKEANFKSALFRPTSHRNETDRYAKVPEATSAVAFDSLGNLTCANSEWRALTRVTSRFEVPCPHCGVPVQMIFSPDAPAANEARRRSF